MQRYVVRDIESLAPDEGIIFDHERGSGEGIGADEGGAGSRQSGEDCGRCAEGAGWRDEYRVSRGGKHGSRAADTGKNRRAHLR